MSGGITPSDDTDATDDKNEKIKVLACCSPPLLRSFS